MKRQFIYGLLSLAVLAGAGLTSCSNEEDFGSPDGQKVQLTIDVSKNDQSRTAFEENNGDLLCTWTADDALLVTNTLGQRLGVISLVEGAGMTTARFKGEVDLTGNQTVNLFYFGNNKPIPETLSGDAYVLDLSAQDGSFASLAANDFMTKQVDVTILNNGEATGSAEKMARLVAEGRFDLQLPDGLQLEAGDVVTISQPDGNFYVTSKIRYADGTSTAAADENGSLTITKKEAGNDIYVTILPQMLTPTFTVTKDGFRYTATLSSHKWIAATYVRNSDGNSGVPVADWTKTELPIDPSDPSNWGGDDIQEVVNYTTDLWDFSKYGLYTNCLDLRGYGGWATWIEYTNGMYSSLLSSKTLSGFYFQWGRLMGFPSNVNSEPAVLQASLANYWFGDAEYPGIPPHYMSDYRKLSVEDSNKYPQCFLCNTGNSSTGYDYCTTNNSCTWESRSGNPCPEGYRLPSAKEMAVFVPGSGEVNGSYAEVKSIEGQNVAMEWKVTATSGNTPGRIDIRMVKTDKTSVTVGDAIFDNCAKTIRLTAYGYLMNDGNFSSRGQAGIYWTNDNGNAGDLLDGVSGNGGQALYFELSGTTAYIMMGGVPRCFGGCVMPIKDSKSHAVKYSPWFPYAGFWPN